MVRYRLLHYCPTCANPLAGARSNSLSGAEERRSNDSGYNSSVNPLSVTINTEFVPSSNSSTNSSESPQNTRGSSPISIESPEVF